MERSLLASTLAIGIVGWLCGLLMTRSQRTGAATGIAIPRPFLGMALLLPFLVFVATLPSHPPLFAPGHGLGWGFLLGGIGALLSGWTLNRLIQRDTSDHAGAVAMVGASAPCFLALAFAVLPLLFLRDNVLDALSGVAIGWFTVTTLLYLGLLYDREAETVAGPPGRTMPQAVALAMISGTAFTILICAVAILGEYRDTLELTPAHEVRWSTLEVVFAAGVPLFLLIAGLPASFFAGLALKLRLGNALSRLSGAVSPTEDTQRMGMRAWRAIISAALLLLLGRLLTHRVVDAEDAPHLARHLLQIMTVGLLGGMLVWWVAAVRARQELEEEGPGAGGWQQSALMALLVLAGMMGAYQTLAGFGVGLLLLAAWLPVSLSIASALEGGLTYAGAANPARQQEAESLFSLQTAHPFLRLLLFGVILLVYRVFYTRFEDDLRGVTLTDHYAIFGFLLGALLPVLLAGYVLRASTGARNTPGSQLFRLIVACAVTLGVPTLIIALWGAKCVLALLIGLALAVVMTEAQSRRRVTVTTVSPSGQEESKRIWILERGPCGPALLPALFALAFSLALMQWTGHVLPLAQLTRIQKVHVLEAVVGSLIFLALLAEVSGRLRGKRTEPETGRVANPASGGVLQ